MWSSKKITLLLKLKFPSFIFWHIWISIDDKFFTWPPHLPPNWVADADLLQLPETQLHSDQLNPVLLQELQERLSIMKSVSNSFIVKTDWLLQILVELQCCLLVENVLFVFWPWLGLTHPPKNYRSRFLISYYIRVI